MTRTILYSVIFFFGLREQLFAQEEKDSSTALSVATASLLPVGLAGAIFLLNYEAFWKNATTSQHESFASLHMLLSPSLRPSCYQDQPYAD